MIPNESECDVIVKEDKERNEEKREERKGTTVLIANRLSDEPIEYGEASS